MRYGGTTGLCGWLRRFSTATAKKTHPVGLSDTASDTIVRCYVKQACPTGSAPAQPTQKQARHTANTSILVSEQWTRRSPMPL
ncbi:hypothetical protein PCASD_21129 [Puccinia coronata f. sp. avenae]|uniref:Uncharacterized protein n=1 Tax=Puccinia coronata f. sp. avenae TaxID=200324 RepID=A0A2N5TKA4_9BASI|nr:hypothetical protein PCASD_21129 [Puccinia coronata f. sp. avenae]